MTLAETFAADPWLLIGSVFLVGLVIGSFLNVVIYRLPVMLERQWKAHAAELLNPQAVSADRSAVAREAPFNLMTPPSRCPACGTRIKPQHNVPVLSYVFLGGKCAACKARIPVRYPVVEFATAVLSAAVAWRFGWQWQMLGALLLTWSLVALTLIDFDHQILPDIITLPLLWLGLLASLGYAAGMTPPLPVDVRSAIIGAAAGYLSLWSIYWAFKLLTGKEGMGYGDFKLFGALGAWMGWQMLPLIILLSAFTGAAVGIVLIIARGRDRNIPIPFGPYLAAAGWIAMMWGPQLVGGYLKAVGLQG